MEMCSITPRRHYWLVVIPILGLAILYGMISYVPINRVVASSNTNTRLYVSESQKKLPTVLCLILTTALNVERHKAVKNTWARRCDKALYVVGIPGISLNATQQKSINSPDFINMDAPETREYLPQKVRLAFSHAYRLYNDSFDWILKCDDDSYVIMENLKRLLSKFHQNELGYIGFRLKLHVRSGYMQGGAGYLLSYSGLQKVVKNWNKPECNMTVGSEDLEMGRCLEKVGIPFLASLDDQGKEMFHPEPLAKLLYPPYSHWLEERAWNKPVYGPGCCSNYSVSFHHLAPSDLYVYEHLLYNTGMHIRNCWGRVIEAELKNE